MQIVKRFNCIKTCNKKLVEANDLSGSQYFVKKKIRFKTPMLRSDLCDSSDTYIIVKETITVEGTNANNRADKELTLRIMLHLAHACQKLTTH